MSPHGPRAAVFATCLAEAFAPQVAEAAAALVARTGAVAAVEVVGGACCGQPAWNAGYPREARALARRLLRRLEGYDLVVVPSGSCAAMLLRYYPHLCPGAGERLAARTHELSAFLARHARPAVPAGPAGAAEAGSAPPLAFHPSCHALRGAGARGCGERCLAAAGCRLVAAASAEECCGFGGLFAVKEPALSTAMADQKLDALAATGARTVVSGELGCLLHLEGRARRRGLALAFRHLAEVLQGD